MKKVALNDLLIKLESGSRPRGGVVEKGIPSLGGQHISSDGTYALEDLKFIPEEYFYSIKKGIIEKDDILIVKDGATTGKIAFIDENYPFKKSTINEHLFKLRVDSNKVIPKYVYYYLLSKKGNHELMKDFRGATVGGITRNFVRFVNVPLPENKETQLKIVYILDISKNLIEKRKAQIEALDQLTQSVFLEMFGDPIFNPRSYKTMPLEDLCIKISGGGTPSKSKPEYYIGDIPWVTPKDMKKILIDDSLDHITEEAVENSSAKIIPKNSVIMVIRSGILKKKLPVAINTREVTVNQDMKAFTVNEELVKPEYILYFFIFYQRKLLSKVRSVTADNLDFKQIKKIAVPVPKIQFQNQFSSIFYDISKQKNKHQEQLTLLENNFQSLLQRAFKGELFTEEKVSNL